MIKNITAVLIAKNAAKTIAETLDSLADFAEIIVYDNGSTDATQSILEKYKNVRLHQGAFMGFGPSKNHAASLASNDWIFSLDADECPDAVLIAELRNWDATKMDNVAIIERENYLMGKCVKRGGWGNDYLVRLYHRSTHGFNQEMVHEQVQTSSKTHFIKLQGKIAHDAVQNLGQFLEKTNRYTEIRRQTLKRELHPVNIVLRAIFAFIKSYIIKGGFLAGWRGLVIAWCDANGVFFKYIKAYADRNL